MTAAEQLTARMMEVLGCKKAEQIFPRLKEIKLLDVCSRCGGTGNYSYNAMTGTRCFGCNGRCYKMPKITASLIKKAADLWTKELADAYFARLKYEADSRKRVESVRGLYLASKCLNHMQALLEAVGLKGKYWMDQVEWEKANQPELNARIHELYNLQKKIDKLVQNVVDGKVWDKTIRGYKPADWDRINAELAPLLAEWEKLDTL